MWAQVAPGCASAGAFASARSVSRQVGSPLNTRLGRTWGGPSGTGPPARARNEAKRSRLTLSATGPVPSPIVDAHTHLFPERLAAAIRGFFVQYLSADAFHYSSVWKDACAVLQAAGVSRCWTLPYVRQPNGARSLNRWMAETFSGDAFVEPGATVHPGDDVHAVIDEALDVLGLRLFKLHCSVGAYALTDDRLDPLWRRVSGDGTPVVVHLGHSPAGNTEASELDDLETCGAAMA